MEVNYNDGRIHGWNGGEQPVHDKTQVRVWFRDGAAGIGLYSAGHLYWSGYEDLESDIIAFQVIKEHREPREIWFNEYENGLGVCYRSTQEEIDLVARDGRIKCVRFREVIE